MDEEPAYGDAGGTLPEMDGKVTGSKSALFHDVVIVVYKVLIYLLISSTAPSRWAPTASVTGGWRTSFCCKLCKLPSQTPHGDTASSHCPDGRIAGVINGRVSYRGVQL